jgi:NAD(P)-dependent dehydrogenase (short-subunit alcohol dehydrogenase family)
VEKGANVAIIARDEAEIRRVLPDLGRHATRGARVMGESCDLRDALAIDAMVATVRAVLGPIDVLVNSAGIIQVGPLETMTVSSFPFRICCRTARASLR